MHLIYLSKGAQATTAIEGNTLSEDEVKQRVEHRLALPPSREYLGREVDNIVNACNRIGSRVAAQDVPRITPAQLCQYNEMVLRDLPGEDWITPGRFRDKGVVVGPYRCPDAKYVPELVGALCRWLEGPEWDAALLDPVALSVVKAVLAHLYVAWIHPFGDGNGRTARLVEFDILLRSGVPSPAAHLLSNHYNATRSEYARQLDLASRKSDPGDFLSYAIEGFRDGLRDQLAFITKSGRDVVWRYYVHEQFRGTKTDAARRQRHIVLDLTSHGAPVPKDQIPTLTPTLRKAFARKTDKTLTRDLNRLVHMQLIRRTRRGYVPCSEVVDAMLPLRAGPGAGEAQPAEPEPRGLFD